MGKLKSVLKNIISERQRNKYHQKHKLEAETLLKSIEHEKGKISKTIKKLTKEYASDVLGWSGFAPWLDVYSAIAGEFKEGWIPDNYYGMIVVPKLKGLYGMITEAKSLTSKILFTDSLPDIAYYVNGLFFSKLWEIIPKESVEEYLFINDSLIVYKVDKSKQGKGIYFFKRENYNNEKIYKMGNGVFQKYIEQHKFFEEIMPNSVATLRLTSIIDNNGKASCRAAYLRIGRSEDTHVKSSNAIKVPVELSSGKLYKKGYLSNFQSINYHPDTNFTFEGKIIPKYNDCVDFILKTHQKAPYCRSIGWDITVNKKENIQLMEWNGLHNDIKFSEATQGPCFADLGWEKLREK